MVKESIQQSAIKTSTGGVSEIEERRQGIIQKREYEQRSEQKYQDTLSELKQQEEQILKAIREGREIPKINKSVMDPYYNAFKEQADYYSSEYNRIKNTTASGLNINDLKSNPDKYKVSYYDNGTIKSITANPETYVAKYMKKKDDKKKNKDETPSSYIPYELIFNPDGTIAKEISRDVTKIKDDYDKRDKGYRQDIERKAYETFVAEYKDGKPVEIKKYGVITKEDRRDKDGDKYQENQIYLKEESKYDLLGNPLSYQKWDDYDQMDKRTDKYRKETFGIYQAQKWDSSSGILTEFARPTEKVKTVISKQIETEAPVQSNKMTITPSNLFGTANNILKAGETEIVYDKSTGQRYTSYQKSSSETIAKLTNLTVKEVETLKKQDPVMLSKVVDDVLEKQLTGSTSTQKQISELKDKQKVAIANEQYKKDWMGNVPIAEELIRKQEEFASRVESADTGKISYVIGTVGQIIKGTGQPKAVPVKKSWGENVIEFGETVRQRGFAGQNLITGEQPKVTPVVKDVFGYDVNKVDKRPAQYVIGTVGQIIKGTGQLMEVGEQFIKSSPQILQAQVNFGNKLFSLVRTGRLYDEYLQTSKKITEKIIEATPIVATAIAVGVKEDIKQTGGIGVASQITGDLLLGYGIGKGLNIIGKGITKASSFADDIAVARVGKKSGEIVTQKTARELSKLGREIKVSPLETFSIERTGVRLPSGEFVQEEKLLLQKGIPKIISPDEVSKIQQPDVLFFKGKKELTRTTLMAQTEDARALAKPRGFITTESEIKGIGSAKKFYSLIDEPKFEVSELDKSFKLSELSKTKQGILYETTEVGLDVSGVPQQFKEVGVGTIRGISVPRKIPKAIDVNQPRLTNQFNVDKALKPPLKQYPIQSGFGLYTFEGVEPIKVAEVFTKTKPITSFETALATKGIANIGGVEVMTKSFYEKSKSVSSFSDIIKSNDKTNIITGGKEQVTILKTETIKEQPQQKTKTQEKTRVKPEEQFKYGISGDTADRPFIYRETITPKPSTEYFKEGIIPKDIYEGARKPGDTTKIIFTETTRKPIGETRISTNIRADNIGVGNINKDLSKYDKKIEPIRETIPEIDSTSMFDTSIKSDTRMDSKIDSRLDTRLETKTETIFDRQFQKELNDKPIREPIDETIPIPKPRLKFGASQSGGFDVLIKEKGKYIKVNPKQPYDYNTALSKMGEVLDNTTARSGKVIKSKSKEKIKSEPSKAFDKNNFYQKPSGVWVEKSKYAINTVGEKQGITVKGWMAQREKTSFNKKIMVPKKEAKKVQSLFNSKSKSLFNTKRGKNGFF